MRRVNSNEYQDDTEYLLSNQANTKRLLDSMNNIENAKEKLLNKSSELKVPNEETLKAIEETKNGEGTTVTLEEFIAERKQV